MTFLYTARLMARYGTGAPFELRRFNRRIAEQDRKFWTAGFDCWWEERVLHDRMCITPRPVLVAAIKKRPVVKLRPEEIEALRERGLVAEYRALSPNDPGQPRET